MKVTKASTIIIVSHLSIRSISLRINSLQTVEYKVHNNYRIVPYYLHIIENNLYIGHICVQYYSRIAVKAPAISMK